MENFIFQVLSSDVYAATNMLGKHVFQMVNWIMDLKCFIQKILLKKTLGIPLEVSVNPKQIENTLHCLLIGMNLTKKHSLTSVTFGHTWRYFSISILAKLFSVLLQN